MSVRVADAPGVGADAARHEELPENASQNVLKEVEAQTGLSIMYDTRELNLERPVTASFDRTPVSQVLREVLDRTVQYSIKDKMIVIYKASATPPPAAGKGKTLTGTVLG